MPLPVCPQCCRVHEPDSGPCTRPPLVGQTLPSGLTIRARVAEIPSGIVFRAESAGTHHKFRLLFTGTADETTDSLPARLSRATAIRHPNVPAVRIGETVDGVRYFACEEYEGELLSETLQAREALPLAEAVELILQAAAGLQAVHEIGLLHGNISPESILVSKGDDGRPLIKLVGFGMSEPALDAVRTLSPYTAPERLMGQPPSVAGDVFSLGAVLYRMLSGRPPGDARPLEGELPAGVWSAIGAALEPIPEQRIPSVAVFRTILQGLGPEAPAAERQMPRRLAPRPARIALAGAIAAVAAGVTLWIVRGEGRSGPAMPLPERSAVAVRPFPLVTPPATQPTDTHVADAGRPAPHSGSRSGRGPSSSPRSQRSLQKARPESSAAEGYAAMAVAPAVNDTSSVPSTSEERPPAIVTDGGARSSTPPPPSIAFKPVPPKSTKTAPTDAMAEARAAGARTLATYSRALEANDLHAVEWIYPDITDRERTAWKKFFGVARDLVVTLNIEQVAVTGAEAKLDVEGSYRYWNRTLHRAEEAPVRFVATVSREGDTWRLKAIR
jgi:serine/threonine protein kinase